MSIWTSKAAAAALILLSGCVEGAGGAPALPGQVRSAPVLDGALRVGAPQGFCIDRTAGREQRDTAVVLMGRCNDAAEAVPAVLTVTVGAAGSGRAAEAGGPALAAYFTSAPGRAALSRDGRAASVQVVEARGSGDAFLMRVRDRRLGEYWRAVVGLRGRLVTISATGSGLDPAAGRKLLDGALAAMRAANRG